MQLVVKLTNFEVTVQDFTYYSMGTFFLYVVMMIFKTLLIKTVEVMDLRWKKKQMK